MSKPDYILDLEKEVAKLSEAQSEIKLNHDADQQVHAKILKTLTSIDHTLKGTEQDPNGLAQEVHTNTDSVETMKRNQAKRDGIIATVSTFAALAVTFLTNWILNKPE